MKQIGRKYALIRTRTTVLLLVIFLVLLLGPIDSQASCHEGAQCTWGVDTWRICYDQPCPNGGTRLCEAGNTWSACNCSCETGAYRDYCVTGKPGVCHYGHQTCIWGYWGTCVENTPASAEECDGLDNDCDGQTDEDCECVVGQPDRECYTGNASDIGDGKPCRRGTQTCSASGWGACTGEVKPTFEICDGIDNDCNGKVDDFSNDPCKCSTDPCCGSADQCCEEKNKTGLGGR